MAESPPPSHPLLRASAEYRDELLAMAWIQCRDWSLADDVVQEALLVAMRRWQSYDPQRSLKAWLVGIVRNTAHSELRKRDQHHRTKPLFEAIAEAASELDEQPQHDRLNALIACIQALPQRSRDLVQRYFIKATPVKVLAAEQGRSINAIDLALSRLRAALRRCAEQRLQQDLS